MGIKAIQIQIYLLFTQTFIKKPNPKTCYNLNPPATLISELFFLRNNSILCTFSPANNAQIHQVWSQQVQQFRRQEVQEHSFKDSNSHLATDLQTATPTIQVLLVALQQHAKLVREGKHRQRAQGTRFVGIFKPYLKESILNLNNASSTDDVPTYQIRLQKVQGSIRYMMNKIYSLQPCP